MPAAPRRPALDVMDSTWLRARPAVVAPLLADAPSWARWWPGLALRPAELRGRKGVRWHVDGVAGHPGVTGTAEVWLQPQGDGVVAHFFLRLDPDGDGHALPHRAVEQLADHYRRLTKQAFWALGDRLDPGRQDRAAHHRLP